MQRCAWQDAAALAAAHAQQVYSRDHGNSVIRMRNNKYDQCHDMKR